MAREREDKSEKLLPKAAVNFGPSVWRGRGEVGRKDNRSLYNLIVMRFTRNTREKTIIAKMTAFSVTLDHTEFSTKLPYTWDQKCTFDFLPHNYSDYSNASYTPAGIVDRLIVSTVTNVRYSFRIRFQFSNWVVRCITPAVAIQIFVQLWNPSAWEECQVTTVNTSLSSFYPIFVFIVQIKLT